MVDSSSTPPRSVAKETLTRSPRPQSPGGLRLASLRRGPPDPPTAATIPSFATHAVRRGGAASVGVLVPLLPRPQGGTHGACPELRG